MEFEHVIHQNISNHGSFEMVFEFAKMIIFVGWDACVLDLSASTSFSKSSFQLKLHKNPPLWNPFNSSCKHASPWTNTATQVSSPYPTSPSSFLTRHCSHTRTNSRPTPKNYSHTPRATGPHNKMPPPIPLLFWHDAPKRTPHK